MKEGSACFSSQSADTLLDQQNIKVCVPLYLAKYPPRTRRLHDIETCTRCQPTAACFKQYINETDLTVLHSNGASVCETSAFPTCRLFGLGGCDWPPRASGCRERLVCLTQHNQEQVPVLEMRDEPFTALLALASSQNRWNCKWAFPGVE